MKVFVLVSDDLTHTKYSVYIFLQCLYLHAVSISSWSIS